MSGMHGFGLTDPVLSTLYTPTKSPVAYIDGSCREPLRSRDQQAAVCQAEQCRQQDAERRRVLERQSKHAALLNRGDSPTKVTALAQIRALFDSGRERPGRPRA
ncbi:hypothetical protein [Arthrobacter dokdonensis]|uniref:hypothetical protein n=1 Tax=Arthrobacter dokdonellae TaxID=2211210 RepID=UPI001013C47F|nr:hypothetical protein [Arthrobacter dokdonellae]